MMILLMMLFMTNFAKHGVSCIDHDLDLDWIGFKQNYEKKYPNLAEESKRRLIWEENLNFIQRHNQENNLYTLKMNKYGDMTNKEFNRAVNNLNASHIVKLYNPINSEEPPLMPSKTQIPRSVNWKNLGYVTDVKDQKYCSSGWAFAAMAAIEAKYRNATSKLISFAEQILLDCPYKPNKSNCSGGTIVQAFFSVNWNGGAFGDEFHPYQGKPQTCNFSDTLNLVEFYVTDLIKVRSPNDNANMLTELVARSGPVAAYLNAHDRSFQFYEKGVYSSNSCDTNDVNHAVTIVGYDTQSNSESEPLADTSGYYIIKNSYGTDWGMDGYMLLSRGPANKCGIALRAYSPVLFIL